MADCFQGKNHTWELSQKFVSYKALRRSFANTLQKQCIVTFNAIYHLLPKHCNMFLQDIIIASKHEILLPNLFIFYRCSSWPHPVDILLDSNLPIFWKNIITLIKNCIFLITDQPVPILVHCIPWLVIPSYTQLWHR